MKKRLIQNLSANTLQLVINQLFGVLMFYVLSVNLSKDSFGLLNLALTVVFTAFNILSFGIDQTVVKKVANGDDARSVLSIYTFHVVFTGILFYGILLLGKLFFTGEVFLYKLILFIGAGKLMIFFSTPLKQVSGGMERFKLQAYMLVVSNIVRGSALVVLAVTHLLSINHILWVFIAGDTLELLCSVYLFKKYISISIKPRWNKTAYGLLVKQSLPQVGVVLITSALARFDWLFIGFMVSAIKLAEYSFAYKVFEISTLPLLAIAPLLIPRFTQLFKDESYTGDNLKLLIRTEMIIATFTGLLLNICWNPLIDQITGGKYGVVNSNTIFILSLCLPFIYLMNFFWTIYFVQNRLKMILQVFLVTFAVNVIGDLVLIPFFKNEGAAIAFLASCVVQAILFSSKNKLSELNGSLLILLKCTACALISGILAKFLFQTFWLALLTSVVFYFLALSLTRQIKIADYKNFRKILGK
ncbi:Membrane protein involved in the export of O-antigen and teichoic acid [Mucilaginibacter lappiensis]|uniref:O-antigen/teichoic acid export membrane protein n=1 Tax=Mucilaginibacter lappiensis TaxID=354630 RepID=A0ABR6PIC2_9SPHI|nr:oligosaccharide flippase family protein [Mucilaginibacter lappiensis]MBB6109524.1 O-antigen/teichoic acid export membrane protein [Mucilaginibacter lappiensis]SIQ91881.1 Membrane protein involved in the export of O-antigen and teichoic acid [Mucilaginibacter lappiensis]